MTSASAHTHLRWHDLGTYMTSPHRSRRPTTGMLTLLNPITVHGMAAGDPCLRSPQTCCLLCRAPAVQKEQGQAAAGYTKPSGSLSDSRKSGPCGATAGCCKIDRLMASSIFASRSVSNASVGGVGGSADRRLQTFLAATPALAGGVGGSWAVVGVGGGAGALAVGGGFGAALAVGGAALAVGVVGFGAALAVGVVGAALDVAFKPTRAWLPETLLPDGWVKPPPPEAVLPDGWVKPLPPEALLLLLPDGRVKPLLLLLDGLVKSPPPRSSQSKYQVRPSLRTGSPTLSLCKLLYIVVRFRASIWLKFNLDSGLQFATFAWARGAMTWLHVYMCSTCIHASPCSTCIHAMRM